jgi:photosystem II stability/assembly factor-like uncharacterized protein
MISTTITCALLLATSAAPTARAAQTVAGTSVLGWKELGPAPIASGPYAGRVSAVACSSTNAGLYYVAGADGGVWRTLNGGLSWTPLGDGMPTTAMGALALDPGDDQVVYAGTGEANYANHSRYGLGLLRSLDGGASWEHLAESTFAGRCFSRIVVDPLSPSVLYAAITRAGGFPELGAAKGHPMATGRLGVFRSTDRGETWTALAGVPNLSTTDLAIDPANPQVLYAGVGRIFGNSQNGIYKSSNGGTSWTKLAGGLPPGSSIGRISLAVAPSQPSRLYALLTAPSTSTGGNAFTLGAYRSDNAGSTWTSIPVGSIQSSYGWYLSVVSVQPTDPDTVIMGGLSLVRSTNAGASFSTITPPHVDLHAVAWDASGRLLVGDDGGVHRSTNLGLSWSSLNQGLGLIQFYAGLSAHPSDPQVFYGGTQDNGSNKRTADSSSWTQVFGGDGGWTQIDPSAPNTVFVEYQGTGNLFRSTDGGGTFSYSGSGISTADRNCFLPPFLIDPGSPNRMLYGTQRVYQSLNGGASWAPLSPDVSTGTGAIRTLAMAPSDPTVVYAATNDGNVLASSDGGASFQLALSGNPGWPRVTRELFVHPTNPQTAYLAVASFGVDQILRTRDGGASWVSLDGNLPDVPVNTVAAVPGVPTRLFAGTDAGLYVSFDAGQNWGRYGNGLPNAPVIDILFERQRRRIVVATQGRGAWSAPLLLEQMPR